MWLMSKDKICPHMQHVDSKDRCNRSTGQGEEKQSFGSRRECKKAELKPDLTERSESDNNFRIFLQSSWRAEPFVDVAWEESKSSFQCMTAMLMSMIKLLKLMWRQPMANSRCGTLNAMPQEAACFASSSFQVCSEPVAFHDTFAFMLGFSYLSILLNSLCLVCFC